MRWPSAIVPRQIVAALLLTAAFTGCARQPAMTLAPDLGSCRARPADSVGHHAVQWIGPDEFRDRKTLNAWCATVGPVAIDGPTADLATAFNALVVVSWNIHVGGGNLPALVQRLRRGDFTDGVAGSDFVLLLQEVYRQGPAVPDARLARIRLPRPILVRPPTGERRDILELARSLGLHVVYAPAMRNGPRDEDRGNAILATRPLTDIQIIELPFERQRRVAVAATFLLPEGAVPIRQLRVVTTHFDTGLALARGGPAAARRRQARALIESLSSWTTGIVVAGDFNSWWGEDEPAVRELRRAFPDASPSRLTTTWGGVFRPLGPLDHMFASAIGSRQQVRRLPDRFGSDHFPLMMAIEFDRGTTASASPSTTVH